MTFCGRSAKVFFAGYADTSDSSPWVIQGGHLRHSFSHGFRTFLQEGIRYGRTLPGPFDAYCDDVNVVILLMAHGRCEVPEQAEREFAFARSLGLPV